MSVHLRRIGNDEHLTEAFNFFDKNQSGYVEFDELKDALSDDDSTDDQVIRDILNDVDLDKVRSIYTQKKTTIKCYLYIT
jgi:calcium-dependent protein kinase